MNRMKGFVFGFVLLALPASLYGRDFWHDVANRSGWQPALELVTTHAKCNRYNFIFTHCSISYRSIYDRAAPVQSLTYGVFFASWGGERIRYLRSGDGRYVTVQSALDHMGQRMFAAGVWLLLMLLLAYRIFVPLRTARPPEAAANPGTDTSTRVPLPGGVPARPATPAYAAPAAAGPVAAPVARTYAARPALSNGMPGGAARGTFGKRR